MAEVIKRGLMTGLGDGYFQRMTAEETETTPPEYDIEKGTEVVPSLQSAETEMAYESNEVFLSNKLHSDLGKLTRVTMTLNAGYLPEGLPEWATGAVELAPGVYGYNSNPIRKFFRFAFPGTDENGKEIIYNFPKCQLEPVGLNWQTETESKEAQITAYNIVGNALIYRPADDIGDGIFFKADLRNEEAATKYDRDKLLEDGWYDKPSLETALKTDPEI